MCSGSKPKAHRIGRSGLKKRHFYAVPGTSKKSSSADKPRGSPKAPENSRISKEIYRLSTAGFSRIPMEPYQKLEALIQPILFNLERKKRDLKALESHSRHKHQTAFMVLLPQYNPLDFSCSALFATHNGLKHIPEEP